MLSHLSSPKNQSINSLHYHFILRKGTWEHLNSDSEGKMQEGRADQRSRDRFFKELDNRWGSASAEITLGKKKWGHDRCSLKDKAPFRSEQISPPLPPTGGKGKQRQGSAQPNSSNSCSYVCKWLPCQTPRGSWGIERLLNLLWNKSWHPGIALLSNNSFLHGTPERTVWDIEPQVISTSLSNTDL